MSDNGNGNIFNFDQSVEHNIAWIKKMAEQHDCSQGIVANAALMTMIMMDHQTFKLVLMDQTERLKKLETALCPSASSVETTKA
jgi:urocanate hydratase